MKIQSAFALATFGGAMILSSATHAAYSGLTDWDRSYIRALYEFDQERVASIQRNEIISRIARREIEDAR